MKIEAKNLAKIGVAVFLTYIAIFYWASISKLLTAVFTAIVPLLIGLSIAYVVNLIMSRYEKWYFPKSQKKFIIKTRRPICLVLALLSLVALIAAIVVIVLPQLTSCINLLIFEKLPEAVNNIITGIDEHELLPDDTIKGLVSQDWGSLITKNVMTVTKGVTNIVDIVIKVVSSVVGGFVTAFLSVMFSVYLLLSKETLLRQSKTLLENHTKPAIYQKIEYILSLANETFRGYIVGQCTEALILGVLCALGMWILGLPYYAMIGALIAFTSLVPIAGAYIGGAIGAFMIFTVDPIKAIIFLVYLIILQQIEGNLIYPKVVGTSVGLPAVWVLVAITIGGGTMGVIGMLLGVPIAAVIYKVLKHKYGTKGV